MELRHLRYFLVVSEELSFTKAAKRLFISQPPLSRQIRELEEEIGTQLFVRNNKKVELTEAGKYFRQEVAGQLRNLEAAVLKTRKIGENLSGEYRIGYIGSTFSHTLTDLVKFLTGKYPYLNIKLYEATTAKQVLALEHGKLDLSVVRAPIISTMINTRLWYKDGFSLVYNHREFGEPLNHLKQVQQEVFVFFNKDQAPTYYSYLLQICAQHGFEPNVVHESNNINSIIQLVRNGLGVSIVPSSIQRNHTYPELAYLELNPEHSTDVLLATPGEEGSKVTDSAISYLLTKTNA